MGRKKVIEIANTRARIDPIQHGETAWSLSGRHIGSTDIPVTGRDEDGARELGQRLRDTEFVHVLTSPRQRARRTSELAAKSDSLNRLHTSASRAVTFLKTVHN